MRYFLPALLLVSIACSDGTRDSQGIDGRKTQSIYGGTVDTISDAVVFLLDENQGGSCTGTLIAKNGNFGYVLTAAHCPGLDYIIQGDDLNCLNGSTCDATWSVVEDIVDPMWTGDVAGGHDFRILRFTGASGLTSVIPIAGTPDGAAAQVMTTIVGYGLTEVGETTARRQVIMPIESVDTLFVNLDQTGGQGFCAGDSGAPFIVNGAVVATASYADGYCSVSGVGTRLSSARDWIQSVIGDGAGGSGGAGGSSGSGGASAGNGGVSNDAGASGQAGAADSGGEGGAPSGGEAGKGSSGETGDAGANTGGTVGTAGSSNSGGSRATGGAPAGGASNTAGRARAVSGGQAATADKGDDGGCGCRAAPAEDRRASWTSLLGIVGLLLVSRRRRFKKSRAHSPWNPVPRDANPSARQSARLRA